MRAIMSANLEELGLEALGFRSASEIGEAVARELSIAVVGAPYPNKDGSNRQFEVKLSSPGDCVELLPEPKNRYDEHAVAVFSVRGVQIGYISSERAPLVGSLLRAGHDLAAVFQEETPWGAVIRVGIDREPVLPSAKPLAAPVQPAMISDEDVGFWPDEDPGW